MRAAIDSAVAADVDVLRVDRARVHADLAADDEAGIGLADEPQRRALAGVLAQAVADRRGAGREREEAPGAGDEVAERGSVRDLIRRDVSLVGRVEDAQRDEVAVGRGVRDVAGAQERRRREAAAHPPQVVGAPGQDEGARDAAPLGVGRRQDHVLPFRVEVAIVPGRVFVHRRARRRVHRDVVDQAFAHDPDPAPVAQRPAILVSCPHAREA